LFGFFSLIILAMQESGEQQHVRAASTAAFTLAHLGLSSTPREDHAQYIASSLRVLKADKPAIFTAASKAQQAADYMIQQAQRD
jgi:antirestriction protein ArdC